MWWDTSQARGCTLAVRFMLNAALTRITKPHYTEEQMMLFDFAHAHTTDEALETIGDIYLTVKVCWQRWHIKRVVTIQDHMKSDEDVLFMVLISAECT